MWAGTVNSYISSSEPEQPEPGMDFHPFSGQRFTAIWLGVAVLVVVAFLGGSEVLIRLRVEPNDLLTRHIALMTASSVRNAVFGDSHAALGFTGQPDVVNLAFPGENTTTMVSKARAYYRRVQPGLVMLQAGPHQFTAKRDREIGRDYDDGRLQIGGIRVFSDWHRPQLLKYWQVALREARFTSNRNLQPDGAQTVNDNLAAAPVAERRQDAVDTVLSQVPPRDLHDAPGFQSLQGFIPELLARGAKVCLISFPVTAAYRTQARDYPSFAAARAQISALAARYEIPHVDLWTEPLADDAFSNADHLNHAAAVRLARRIKRECLQPFQAHTAKG